MNRFRTRWGARAALAAVALVVAAVAASGAMTASSAPTATLVVDRSFEIKTADPQRAFEPTASIVDRGIYDTFFTYRGGDLAHPVPQLVQSWKASKDAKTFSVQPAPERPLRGRDAAHGRGRRLLVQASHQPQGEPLLPARRRHRLGRRAGTRSSFGRRHRTRRLPSILTNTSLGVVNSKLVRKHGGTSAVGADKNDKAEKWLNSSASRGAGSGPYLLQRYSTTSQITLVPNPRYWGSKKASVQDGRGPQHDRADAADQHPARHP